VKFVRMIAFGSNSHFQLGNGSSNDINTPCHYTCPKFRNICCGGTHCLALDNISRIWTWGENDYGQCCPSNLPNSDMICSIPTLVSSFPLIVEIIACGWKHSALVTSQGRMYTWGSGVNHELGHGEAKSCRSPQLVRALEGNRITQIACGWRHTGAVAAGHGVWLWGCNRYGQLGLGDCSPRAVPTLLTFPPFAMDVKQPDPADSDLLKSDSKGSDLSLHSCTGSVVAVQCGMRFSLFLSASSEVFACGSNSHGQLGLGLRGLLGGFLPQGPA